MLTQYTMKMPHAVYSGENALANIADIINHNGFQTIAVFTDQGVKDAGILDPVIALIKDTGSAYTVLGDLSAEPSYQEAQRVIDSFKKGSFDFIIAIGGGSVMDVAKLASVCANAPYTVKDLLDTPAIAKKHIQTLMIPSTAGTGAEATPNSIVAVPEKELKVGIVNDAMIADYVILDASVIKKLPRPIAAATGIDALCHAIECYTSKKANYFSDLYALEALKLIFNHLKDACDDQNAIAAKNAMLIASFYAGCAITASGTTAVHALSYPLGGKYHIAHGVSNAMLLLPVMRFNAPCCQVQLATIYDAVNKGQPLDTVSEKVDWVLKELENLVRHLNIPVSLKDYGVTPEDLELLVKAGMGVTRLLVNNIREVKEADARAIYQSVL